MKNILYFGTMLLILVFRTVVISQEALRMPNEQASRDIVSKASEWLVQHVKSGSMQFHGKEIPLSVIAWKDPTLESDLPGQLAGYAITDTLWASYTLSLTHPELASELHQSLKSIDCLTNNLHEVIWQRIENINHKPIDMDIVHGSSLGVLYSGGLSVDVRSFTMNADSDFNIGHPLLFVEHAVYQSLFEHRNGDFAAAKDRIRDIFRPKSGGHPSEIQWDAEHKLLIDFVTRKDYKALLSGESSTCRQYSFKLAIVLYACRLLKLDDEFSLEMLQLQKILRSIQFSDGGIPHFFDVRSTGEVVNSCPDATGEATAIFVLAETVAPRD